MPVKVLDAGAVMDPPPVAVIGNGVEVSVDGTVTLVTIKWPRLLLVMVQLTVSPAPTGMF